MTNQELIKIADTHKLNDKEIYQLKLMSDRDLSRTTSELKIRPTKVEELVKVGVLKQESGFCLVGNSNARQNSYHL